MRAIIIGGSNSLKGGGWTSQLMERASDIEFSNQSIGAAPSIMGYYRLLTGPEFGAGDIVIWEYALNDESQISKGKYEEAAALKHLELIIRHVAAKSAYFLPVIFAAKANSSRSHKSSYAVGIDRLFAAYGLKPVRATELYCAAHRVNQVPEGEYLNQLHYAPSGAVIPLVLDEVLAQLSNPLEPKRDVAPIQTIDQPDCRFVSDFSGGRQYQFQNSILHTAIYLPLPDSPLAIRIPKGSWTVVGAIIMRSTVPSVLAFEFDGVSTRISLGHKNRNYKKSLLGFRQFTTGSDIIVHDGSVVRAIKPGSSQTRSNAGAPALASEHGVGHGLISLILEPGTAIRSRHGGAETAGAVADRTAG